LFCLFFLFWLFFLFLFFALNFFPTFYRHLFWSCLFICININFLSLTFLHFLKFISKLIWYNSINTHYPKTQLIIQPINSFLPIHNTINGNNPNLFQRNFIPHQWCMSLTTQFFQCPHLLLS
jgi:hypothetical protein